MGKYKLGGYIFISWKGDHPPRHLHVYKDGNLILKWNLEAKLVMKGKVSAKLLKLINKLSEENQL